jgi:4-hydroxybenzoate polyprenyltransferase
MVQDWREGPSATRTAFVLLQALRPLHWTKNALIFVPFLEGHHTHLFPSVGRAVLTFVAFCLCASSAYVINDILDLECDRRHPTKSRRPLAAGRLSPRAGVRLAAGTAFAGLGIGALLPASVYGVLLAYCFSSLAYSIWFRRVEILDVMVLAGFFTLRLLAGALASGEPTSSWFFAMAVFMFLSLGLVKRTNELRVLRRSGVECLRRAYRTADLEPLVLLGLVCGMIAVALFVVFVGSVDARLIYAHPERLWFLVPVAIYWVARLWLLAYRGRVDEDPVVFALKDRTSYVMGMLAVGIALAAL